MKTTKVTQVIQVQDRYVETVNAGIARWAHRPKQAYEIAGGHAGRIIHGARRIAERDLRKLGYTDQKQIDQIIADARDVADLERNAIEEAR